MWSNRKTPPMLVEEQTYAITLEISMVTSQKIGNQSTSRPSNTTLSIYPKDSHSYHSNICLTMLIAAFFKCWKQHRFPSTEEWKKKIWYIYTMEYYSEVKSNNILKIASKWMELENKIMSKKTQPQKDKYGMYYLLSGY